MLWLQTSASLQNKLRRGNFRMLERPPRMLPRMFTPVQINVDCSAKTPVKEPEPKKGRKGKSGKAQGGNKAAGPSSAGGRTSAAGDYLCKGIDQASVVEVHRAEFGQATSS